ncbi:hypothetical protein PILCRDRAFT_17131 [Piloderma croceum F 1598]|uniref:Uncharacterized protein n=1 Tax=Piloderma croceum (strain F 1598) TaxID=765440 RepID=A0A0C3AC59_PILCF|nr:hypothetical protein PILCRDRAFT_17131 [Piloderma croceum F 1598]
MKRSASTLLLGASLAKAARIDKVHPDQSKTIRDNAIAVFQQLTNVGSTTFNVLELSVAGQIGIQIAEIIKTWKVQANWAEYIELMRSIAQILNAIQMTSVGKGDRDISSHLTKDLNDFKWDLEYIRNALQELCEHCTSSGVAKNLYMLVTLRMDCDNTCHKADMSLEQDSEHWERSHCLSPMNVDAQGSTINNDHDIGRQWNGKDFNGAPHLTSFSGQGDSEVRYLVGCNSVISGGALALLILQTIQHKIVPNKNSSDVLYQALSSYPCILLLLDNFETMWNSESNHTDIHELLSKIVSLPKVSLIITSQGDTPPSGVKWTRVDCLPPLSPESAKELFLDLHYGESGDFEGNHTLMTLLKELDYIPLTIHLIFQACSGFSLRHMLKLWCNKRTALLRTCGKRPDKLESIKVSISISLSSLNSTNNHQAVQLLAVLCLLPDGLLYWEERLLDIGSKFENVHRLLQSLRRTSLVFISNDILKVLSPIRHFVTDYHPAAESHMKVLEAYFWNLVATYATRWPGDGFIKATHILEQEVGNLCSLVQNNIQCQPTTETIEIALQISQFLIWTHPSVEILDPVVSVAVDLKVGTPSLQAQCLQCLGDILHMQDNYKEAADILKKA